MRKVAIVGSKSLNDYDAIYRIIDEVITKEIQGSGPFVLVNSGEEGVDLMGAEIAHSRNIEYELVPLEECREENCAQGKMHCFEHSYKRRSRRIAEEADKIYRIYDETCGNSTCEVTAMLGDELQKQVVRMPIDILSIER